MKSKIFILVSVLLFGQVANLQAEVKPAAIFGNGMVLQRDTPLKIWGTADPREKVTVSLDGKAVSVKADKEGRWTASLPARPAGGPHEITVAGKDSKVEFTDVLMGDVWLCSGQSNMEWVVKNSNDAEKEIAAANYPNIRSFNVRRSWETTPEGDLTGAWAVCSPETVGNFTAVGYFFAREIHNETGVPIGVINSSWGGTDIEVWTSPETYATYSAEVKDTYKVRRTDRLTPGAPVKNPNDRPSSLYNSMIKPLVGLPVKGALWYQGENNADSAYAYRTLFPGMITDWRDKWGLDFPFYWVQLTNINDVDKTPVDSKWAELREAQTMTLSLPHTGQAVIIDIGEANDIHPRNKQDVGRRLALIALHNDYGRDDVVFSGPTFSSMTTDRGRATIEFDNGGSPLVVRNKYGYPEGFAVAGADRVFHWAQARLTRDGKVVVWSSQVREPVAVRYGWSQNPEANLYNAAGLPATPFRTDDWPGITR